MTKVTKKNFEAFKNLKLSPKKVTQVKGGTADNDPIIVEEIIVS